MRKVLNLLALVALMAVPAAAQMGMGSAPVFEIGGVYTYRSFAAPLDGATSEPRMAMNGWGVTADYNLNSFLGVVTDFDWTRANVPHDPGFPGKDTFSTLMAGPQIYPIGHHKLTPFAHFEVGLAEADENIAGIFECGNPDVGSCSNPYGSFAIDAGGGIDVSFSKYFAVRLAQFDWDQSRMFGGVNDGNKATQNNYKLKAGIIVRFGEK